MAGLDPAIAETSPVRKEMLGSSPSMTAENISLPRELPWLRFRGL